MSNGLKDATELKKKFEGSEVIEFRGEATVILPLERLFEALQFAHDKQKYDLLMDVSSLDHGEDAAPRFEMVYELTTALDEKHLRVRSVVEEDQAVPSAVEIWATADWHEREVYDMMGITFENHPDLRRILMWEGYTEFPLRKDFPLAGTTTELPDVAFTGVAPLEGGPFVTSPGSSRVTGEPRAKGES